MSSWRARHSSRGSSDWTCSGEIQVDAFLSSYWKRHDRVGGTFWRAGELTYCQCGWHNRRPGCSPRPVPIPPGFLSIFIHTHSLCGSIVNMKPIDKNDHDCVLSTFEPTGSSSPTQSAKLWGFVKLQKNTKLIFNFIFFFYSISLFFARIRKRDYDNLSSS